MILAAAGCSLVAVRPPPEPDPITGQVECSSSLAPAGDAVLAVAAGLAAATGYALTHLFERGNDLEAALWVTGAVTPFAASSTYGSHWNGECRRLKAAARRPTDPGDLFGARGRSPAPAASRPGR
jgi:hypothetical protein